MNHTVPYLKENPEDHICDCEQMTTLPFLDTNCAIKNGKIVTDLFRKETDRNQYLLPSSCHPSHVTNNIPFSLALRIVRICTEPEARERRFLELKAFLIERNYKAKLIDGNIEKARQIPRTEGHQKS